MNYKAVIVAPGGSRAYMIFEAESLEVAKWEMDVTLILTFFSTSSSGSIESIEETTEAVTDGLVVTEWGPGQGKGRPLPFPIGELEAGT